MAGIYGSHPEDRHYENMLDDYLDKTYDETDTEEEDDEDETEK